jgi:hypothetical protein
MGVVVMLKQGTELETAFDEFWEIYPSCRRTGKAICKSKWDAITSPTGLRTRTKDRDADTYIHLTLSATPEEIIAGLKRACMLWRNPSKAATSEWKEDGKYIPLPSTFLNQGRWLD